MALFRKRKKKVCVIGLDGVPYSLLLDLAQKEIIPATANLINTGHLHRMKASLPEISSVSWTNFMTGTNPGTHGIFGFTDVKRDSYELRFPNFLDLKTDTFWDELESRGKKCIIINQPSTYPARRINGILISGFVAIELAKAVFPPSSKAALERIGYQIDLDTLRCRQDHEFLWQELTKILRSREKALELFWKDNWDYFEFVITGTDRLHHFLWNACEDETHRYHQNFLDYYSQIDTVIDKISHLFEKLPGEQNSLYLLSDHGFTGIEQEVYLNTWLEMEGYLKFKTASPESLADIHPSSQVFALDPNRIYLNLKGKFPQGSIEPSGGNTLKKEISQKLKKLDYEGKKVVREVFDAEDIYSGPYFSQGPDLIVLAQYGFDMKGSVKKREIFGRSDLQGMHTWDDAFFWARDDYGSNLSISDLAKIIKDKIE